MEPEFEFEVLTLRVRVPYGMGEAARQKLVAGWYIPPYITPSLLDESIAPLTRAQIADIGRRGYDTVLHEIHYGLTAKPGQVIGEFEQDDDAVILLRCPHCNSNFGVDFTWLDTSQTEGQHPICPICHGPVVVPEE